MFAVTSPAYAAPKSALAQWFCATLKPPFDAQTAFKTFPLDTLGEPMETRVPMGVVGKDIVAVTVRATGDDYTVEYRYQFDKQDVTDQLGFSLAVSLSNRLINNSPDALAWIREFGNPRKNSASQWEISAGPKDRVLTLGANSGEMRAEWLYADGLQYASLLCK
jgi:hypothetical protein